MYFPNDGRLGSDNVPGGCGGRNGRRGDLCLSSLASGAQLAWCSRCWRAPWALGADEVDLGHRVSSMASDVVRLAFRSENHSGRRWASYRPDCASLLSFSACRFLCLTLAISFKGRFGAGEYEFISETMSGIDNRAADGPPVPGNRFADTVLGRLWVPLPTSFLQGIDLQRYDFEQGLPSYFKRPMGRSRLVVLLSLCVGNQDAPGDVVPSGVGAWSDSGGRVAAEETSGQWSVAGGQWDWEGDGPILVG